MSGHSTTNQGRPLETNARHARAEAKGDPAKFSEIETLVPEENEQRGTTMAKRNDAASLTKLEARAANLKTAKIKAEREFIDARAKELTPDEQKAVQKKRDLVLYQLEMEGAEIESGLVLAYRRKFEGLGFRFTGFGLQTLNGCPFCTTCVTSCLECVTSCTACVACSNDVF